jgi:hypothetical protein
MSWESILPSRFHDCQPWTSVLPLRVLFKASDVKKIEECKNSQKTPSHAQYSDFHSFLPLVSGSTSTIEIIDAIDKGLASFDNMFLFDCHSNKKSEKNNITNGVYSSYDICKELKISIDCSEDKIYDFFKIVYDFLEKFHDSTVVCQLYIILIRTLYYNIVLEIDTNKIAKKIKDKDLKVINGIFKEKVNLEQDLDFLCMKFYQCIVRIQIAYMTNNKQVLSSLYTEFKIIYSLILKESQRQKLPFHLVSNDDENVPFLFLLNDYVFSLVQSKIQFEPQLTRLKDGTHSHKFGEVYGTVNKTIGDKFQNDKIKQTLQDYLLKCYSHLYEHFISTLDRTTFNSFIITTVDNYDKPDSIIQNLLSDDLEKQNLAFKAIVNYESTRGISTYIWTFFTNQNYKENWAPIKFLQCDLVRYFMKLHPSERKIVIGKALSLKMKVFLEEELLMDCKVVLKENQTEYWYILPDKIMMYDTHEKKKTSLRRSDGKVFDYEGHEVTKETPMRKLLLSYNRLAKSLVNELQMFSSFESIFSIELLEKNSIIYLKNTDLTLELSNGDEEINLFFDKKKWKIERSIVYKTDKTLEHDFLFILKNKDVVSDKMYLMIFTPILNNTSVPETFLETTGNKEDEHGIKLSNTLNWKKLFVGNNTKTGVTALPGKKTGSIIFKDPSELLLNPYAFHRYIKYSFLYFFDNNYTQSFNADNPETIKAKFKKSENLQLWYLYMRNTGIQFESCINDFKATISNQTITENEKNVLKTIKKMFFSRDFFEKLFKETTQQDFKYAKYDIMPRIPPMFDTTLNSNDLQKKINGNESTFLLKNKLDDKNLELIIDTLLHISGKAPDGRVKIQIEKLKSIYNAVKEGKRIVYDLPMGFGKTSSLLPCLLYTSFILDFKKVVVIVPFNLVQIVKSQLTLFSIYFDVFELSASLEEVAKEKGSLRCVVCSDYDYKSFITDHTSQKDLFDLVIVDEVDSLFDNLKSDFFKSDSFQYLSNIYDKVSAIDTLYSLLLDKYKLDSKHKTLMLPEYANFDTFISNEASLSPYRKYPWFTKFPNIIYEVNLTMKYELNYGLAKDNKRFFAVPYLTAKVPSPNNQFSTPDMVLILTYISYMNCSKDDNESYEPIIERYNQNCSIKDIFKRSKHPGKSIDINEDYFYQNSNLNLEKKRDTVSKIVVFVFQSNFQYAASMTYTSMIDATSSTYTKYLVGFSGTITLTNPFEEDKQITTMIKYQDTNNSFLEFEAFKYDEDSGYPGCVTVKESIKESIYNNQLCFLEKIQVMSESYRVPDGSNIIYLDIGDVFLYTPENDIKSKITKDCLPNNGSNKQYEFLAFKNGKLSKTGNSGTSPVIYFYDHANCRGTDYNFDNGKYSIVISISLRQGTTDNYFSEFLQALYRVRKLHTYFDDYGKKFKNGDLAITSIFIYCNTNDPLPTDSTKIIGDLIKKEKEAIDNRKSYAKIQYKRYLEHVCGTNFTVKEEDGLNINQCTLKNELSKFSLGVNDISNLKAQSSTNTDYENKNQLQTQNDLEIRKSGDKQCFEVKVDEYKDDKPFKQYFLHEDYLFQYFLMSSKSSNKDNSRKLRLQNSDLAYFYDTTYTRIGYSHNLHSKAKVYILPIVFKQSTRFENYAVYNMFGNLISEGKSDLHDLHVIIRLINNLIPYDITNSIMLKMLKDRYMFEKIYQIDYLYPFNMITYPKIENDVQKYDLVNLYLKDAGLYPFPPLLQKAVVEQKSEYSSSFYELKVKIQENPERNFESEKYKYFQYTSNIKSMDIQFIRSSDIPNYLNAVNNFFETKKKLEDFESNLKSVEIAYDTSKCILKSKNEDTSCRNNGGIEDKLTCQKTFFTELFKGPIFEFEKNDMTYQTFTEMPWDSVIKINENKINIGKFGKDLLFFLIGSYNAFNENKIDCTKLNDNNIKDYIKYIAEYETTEQSELLKELKKVVIQTVKEIKTNVASIEDVEEIKTNVPPKEDDKIVILNIKKLVDDLKMIKMNESSEQNYKRTIILFIYRYQIYQKFGALFDTVYKYIENEISFCNVKFSIVKKLFNTFKKFEFIDMFKNMNIETDEIKYVLRETTPLYPKLKERYLNIEDLQKFLENSVIIPDIRSLILEKLIDERWTYTCDKVIELYNKLPLINPNDKGFKVELMTLNSYFKDLNSKLFNASFIDDSKVSTHSQYQSLQYTETLKTKVDAATEHFKQQYPYIWRYLKYNRSKSKMEECLYVMLTLDIPLPPKGESLASTSSATVRVSSSGIKNLAATALVPVGLLALQRANKKYNLTQKAKDYFFSRWSKKKEVPVALEEKNAIAFNSKRNPVRSSLKSAVSINPKKTMTKKPSVQKNSRKKNSRP